MIVHIFLMFLGVIAACTAGSFLPPHDCLAASSGELHLKDAIEGAARQPHSKATGSRLDVAIAEQENEEIFGTFYAPRFELTSYSGLVPGAEGDITSEDTNVNDDLGPFFKIDLKAIQPLYSFGKYNSAKEAGKKNLEMKQALAKEAQNDLALEVTKVFFGVVASRDGTEVSDGLRDNYSQLLQQLEKLLEEPHAEFDAADLLEAKTLHFEIEKQCAAIVANTEQALLYLKGLLDLAPETLVAAVATTTPRIGEVKDLSMQLQTYFREDSQLLQGLRAGMEALTQKLELERRKRYPDLFMALGAGYGAAPNRDKLDNAFVQDDFNYEKVGGTFGLKWDLNYHVSETKIQKTLIEYQQLAMKRELTLKMKEGTIAKLCGEAARNQGLLEAAGKSLKSATTWVRLEKDNMDLGLGNMKRFIKAHQYYYQLKGDVISTRYQYLVSLAELAHAAGDMNLLLHWLDHGKVQL